MWEFNEAQITRGGESGALLDRIKGRMEFYISLSLSCLKPSPSGDWILLYKKHSVGDEQEKERVIYFANNSLSEKHFKVDCFDSSFLFDKISVENLVLTITAILLEWKIVIVNSNSGQNSVILETLLSLIYPLQWNMTIIPVIPIDQIDYIDAPFPYLCGVEPQTWKEVSSPLINLDRRRKAIHSPGRHLRSEPRRE